MVLRSCAFGEPLELLGIDRIPKANKIKSKNENIMIIAKINVELDAVLRDGPRTCLPFTAIIYLSWFHFQLDQIKQTEL